MNAELSIWQLFMDAGMLVQMIMLLLLGLSILSWTLIFQYYRLLKQTSQRSEHFAREFWAGGELNTIYEKLSSGKIKLDSTAAIFVAGMKDFLRFAGKSTEPAISTEHIERAMRVAIMRERETLQKNINWLATIGSVSPYIGLFGTVWGIMHSFIALGGVQQATLAMVAPGIAEALVATAMGLFAAIPAVVAYNRFSNHINQLVNSYQTFGEEVLGVLQKKLLC
jgi:biopolymer transport protein TolQ